MSSSLQRLAFAVVIATGCAGPTVGGEQQSDAGDGAAGSAGSAGSAGHDAAADAAADAGGSGGQGPVVLASGRDCPTDLRVHAGVVVWTDQGSLQNSGQDGVLATMPAAGCADDAGGCITVLAKDQLSPAAVEIDRIDGTLYWSTIVDGTIWRLPSGATNPETYAPGQDWPRWLAIDQTALYWTNAGSLGQNDGEIRRSWLEDGTPGGLAIVSALPSPHALTIAGNSIFWTSYGINDTDGRVMVSDLTGKGVGEIATGQSDPRGLAVNASHVYWANAFDGTLMRAKRDGTEITALFSQRSTPSDVALDAAGVYWVEAGTPAEYTDGLVMAARLDGSELTTIATGQRDPRRIELDGDSIYWINRGTQGVAKCSQHDGAVMRADKPW